MTLTPQQILMPAQGDVSASDLAALLQAIDGRASGGARTPVLETSAGQYTITAADLPRLLIFTGQVSVGLTVLANVPNGGRVRILSRTTFCNLVPGGATINGGQPSNFQVPNGAFCDLVYDGVSNWTAMITRPPAAVSSAGFRDVGTEPGNVIEVLNGGFLPALNGANLTNVGGRRPFAPITTPGTGGSVTIAGLNAQLFMGYEVFFTAHMLGTAAQLSIQFSADNGVNFLTGASDYDWNATLGNRTGSLEEAGSAAGGSNTILITPISNVTASGRVTGSFQLLFPDMAAPTFVMGQCAGQYASGFGVNSFAGQLRANTVVNALRLRTVNTEPVAFNVQVVGLRRGAA